MTTPDPYAVNPRMDEIDHYPDEPRIFSLHGRLGRVRYLVYSTVLGLLGLLLSYILLVNFRDSGEAGVWLWLFVFDMPIVLTSLILAKRRLNDLNIASWWSLLLLIPVLNVILGLYLIAAPGTQTPNHYGSQPPPNKALPILAACIFPLLGIIGIIVVAPMYSPYTRKAKFSEVVLATAMAKYSVETCAQDRGQTGHWQITACGAGNNGVPQDVTVPSGFVAKVQTADHGVITATAINGNGLHGETYILIPAFNNNRITWTVKGSCKTTSPILC